ncbi:MAG TPA: hypothetical protein DCQ98_17645 [Planctomycetaceae bacterium]|nr:hypothetical protein [Planctomycetaceae bacterium]
MQGTGDAPRQTGDRRLAEPRIFRREPPANVNQIIGAAESTNRFGFGLGIDRHRNAGGEESLERPTVGRREGDRQGPEIGRATVADRPLERGGIQSADAVQASHQQSAAPRSDIAIDQKIDQTLARSTGRFGTGGVDRLIGSAQHGGP